MKNNEEFLKLRVQAAHFKANGLFLEIENVSFDEFLMNLGVAGWGRFCRVQKRIATSPYLSTFELVEVQPSRLALGKGQAALVSHVLWNRQEALEAERVIRFYREELSRLPE